MSVQGKVDELLKVAAKLKSSSGNEANTKALLIEPLLASLGWDPTDLDQVEREFRVFEGTLLDYALKVDGKPRLVLEAKAVGRDLEDNAFVAQTVNYANNAGVVWCVLTNGISYRVYKTNEPVAMGEKLLFEVDLSEAASGAASEVARQLRLISFDSLSGGELESWGESVFVDKRVREALAALAAKPPNALLDLVGKSLGKPTISPERLKESLGRIFNVEDGEPIPLPGGVRPGPSAPAPGKTQSSAAAQFTLEHHLGGKPAAIVDLFEQVDEFARSLGANVSRRIRKYYVGYYAGKRSFCTLEIQRQRVIVYLNLDPTTISPWNDHAMRDVRNIGHFGMGDTEFSLRESSQLDDVKNFIKQAHASTS